MTKSGAVDYNILLVSGSDRSCILNSALDKLETKHISVEDLHKVDGVICTKSICHYQFRYNV